MAPPNIVVLEIGGGIAASYAASLLRGFGARVIKVEPPGGDSTRSLSPFFTAPSGEHVSALFHHLNRGKAGIVLDPEDARTAGVLRALVQASTIVFQDVGARIWPAPEALIEQDGRRRAYVELSPFGSGGPCDGYAAPDMVLFAASGRMYRHGRKDAEPLQYLPGLVEFQHGLTAAAVASAFLLPGPGTTYRIDVSGMEALVGNVDSLVVACAFTGEAHPRGHYGCNTLPCGDGYVHIPLSRPHYNARLCVVIGHPELLELERFKGGAGVLANRDEFLAYLLPWCLERTRSEIIEELQRNKIMCTPLLTVSEVIGHPQYAGFFQREPAGDGRELVAPGRPFSGRGLEWRSEQESPSLGADTDTDAVIAEFVQHATGAVPENPGAEVAP